MGLFTAYYASRHASKITILEQSHVGDPRSASFSLTRSIRNDYLDPLYARLAHDARQLWLDLQQESAETFLVQCGCLNIAKASVTPRLAETYAERSHRTLKALQLKTEAFTRHALARRFPQFDADLARLDVEAGLLYVPPITRALLTRLRQNGVSVQQGVTLRRLTQREGHIVMETSAGERAAARLVITAGLGTNQVLSVLEGCDLRFPLRPDRPSQAKYVIPPRDQRALFLPAALPVFAYLDVGIYGHPMLEGKTPGVKIGCYNPPDVPPVAGRITDVESFVAECMPGLRGAEMVDVKEVDQCSYDLVADDNFILGRLPGFPSIAVGAGWRGTGYKFAPLIGRTLAQLALEDGSDYHISRFSPERFVSTRAG